MQYQRSNSNIMSKSHYYQEPMSLTTSGFYKRDRNDYYDIQLDKYYKLKQSFNKPTDLRHSYYNPDKNRTILESYKPRHLQTIGTESPSYSKRYDQNFDYVPKKDDKIRVEQSFAIDKPKTPVVSNASQYMREREQIMSSLMTNEEIQKIKAQMFRRY